MKLFFWIHQTLHKPALHEEYDQNRRQHDNQRAGKRDIPVWQVIGRWYQVLKTDNRGQHFGIGGDEQWPQILVPAIDKLYYNQGGNIGFGKGQQYFPEKNHGRGPVHFGRFTKFFRDSQKKLTKKKGVADEIIFPGPPTPSQTSAA
jgi:hypothetical protein